MGFGTILLGYILTLFDAFGAGIIGCPLMAYGFSKLNRINGRFGVCAVFSVIALYEPVLQVLAIFELVDPMSTGFLIAHVASYVVKLLILVNFYAAVGEIASAAKALKLQNGAKNRLYINCAATLVMVVSALWGGVNTGTELLINIAYAVSGIMNILFIWDCASKITTREQMTKDKLALKHIEDEEKKKAEKRKLKEKEEDLP